MPQPPVGQTRAAAKATAADERPLPGGPVKIQACVISCDSCPLRAAATAPCRISVMWDWPTNSSKMEGALISTSKLALWNQIGTLNHTQPYF